VKAVENRAMTTLRVPTEEEIRATYRQGEEAVVARVGELLEVVAILAKRVQELEDQQQIITLEVKNETNRNSRSPR